MASAWQAARGHIQNAQSKQKWNYDKSKKLNYPVYQKGTMYCCTSLQKDAVKLTN